MRDYKGKIFVLPTILIISCTSLKINKKGRPTRTASLQLDGFCYLNPLQITSYHQVLSLLL